MMANKQNGKDLLKCTITYYSQKFKNFLTIFQVSIYFTIRSEAFSKNRSYLYDSEISSYIFETANKNLSFKFVCFFQFFKGWIKASVCIICGEMFCTKSNSNPHFQVHHTILITVMMQFDFLKDFWIIITHTPGFDYDYVYWLQACTWLSL